MSATDPSYRRLVENAPVGVFTLAGDYDPTYANAALADLLLYDSSKTFLSEVDSLPFADSGDRDAFRDRMAANGRVEAFETQLLTKTDEPVDVLLSGTHGDGEFTGYAVDITSRKRLERSAEEQSEAILELSTPIVQIWDGITLATVVGTLDTDRAQRLTEALLTELSETQSDVALIDITGVPNIDTATAQHLIDTVNAVTLLGSGVIITGINPEIAQTLVQLGITMDDIRTKSSLSEGLELGLQLLNGDVTTPTESIE